MNMEVMDAGVGGGLEVDSVLIALSTELKFERCTSAKCGEAGKSVSERGGITRSSARALTGEHGSVAHSSTLVRRLTLCASRIGKFCDCFTQLRCRDSIFGG